ncbi:HET-domain-containing protein, partial [Zopfia rhizophila CBS 207.26]
PHLCRHCEKIVFTLGDSISFPYREVEQAHEAGCRFFRLILEKRPIADTSWTSRCPTLVVYCGEHGNLDFRWMDGATILFDSVDHWIDASPIFAPKGSPASAHFRARLLNPKPGSEKSIGLMRRWIRECDVRHTRCKELRKVLRQQCPTRLIDVGNEKSMDVRICSTATKSAVRYAALSYCWGGEQQSKTIHAKLKDRLRGFPLEELPKTIQDAVITTRRLGLQYLWVDAICIIQDDEADKERELAIMYQIYSGASVTIEAARAETANDGFLQHRNVNQCYGTVCNVKYRRSSVGIGDIGSSLLSANRLDITYDDPIDSRGWTFQEHRRSLRTLRFGCKQTVWECPQSLRVDGGEPYIEKLSSESLFTGTVADLPYPYQLKDTSHRHELNRALEAWQQLVDEYSRRSLGQRTDRLPAFAAIAEAFGTFLQVVPEQYLAGLWAFDISMQLRWRRPDDMLGGGWCKERHGPTWSWASLDGPVTFD